MLLMDRLHGFIGKLISWLLIITTQGMAAHIAYAQDEFSKAVQEANQFTSQLLNKRSVPSIDSSGNLSSGGEVIFSQKDLTGQKDEDYLPASANTFGDDAGTLIQGQTAQSRYESMDYDDATTSGERAYHIINRSFATQKPDLSSDPMWNNTDNVLDNIEEIAKDFAECRVSKELVSTGEQLHVPVYKQCERLPAIEETLYIGHDYEVGVIKHKSGPVNLQSCGDGCLRVWIGTVGNNYWRGWCDIYEEEMSLELIQPDKISYAKLERSKYDDYHQVYINNIKVYNGPNGEFPPEVGTRCELSKSWDTTPNVNITNYFTSVPRGGELKLKTRTSVAGKGEGYSALLIHYDQNSLIYNDVWTDDAKINTAHKIKKQIDDGFCEGHFKCTNSPSLDANGCATINGFNVCEDDFKDNPMADLGVTPFCKTVEVVSNCNFNEGELCWKDMDGNENCFDNDTQSRNTCEQYEQDPTCSFIKTDCVEGAEGPSGKCYVQEDTFDCGFTVNDGTTAEEDVVICDGQLQCVGESCYSPHRDLANDDFGQANAYLEMLKWAKNDMDCEGVPDAPYDPVSPPDQYTPIESCADGYQYYPETKQCLKQISCDYGDNDFYAAGEREGIQVVKNGSVLVENDSIPVCVPVSKNGQTFTCGDAMKKLSTDTFHEVCTSQVGSVIPNGCPNDEHDLNPVSGFCEIPPIATCPAGVPLIEGDNPWSVEDDKCLLEVPASYECNDNDATYNSSTGLCESNEDYFVDAYCETGLVDLNGNCVSKVKGCHFSYANSGTDIYWSSGMFGGPTISNSYVIDINAPEGYWPIGNWVLGHQHATTLTTYDGETTYTRGSYMRRDTSHHLKLYEVCMDETKITDAKCPVGTFGEGAGRCKGTNIITELPTTTCSVEGSTYDPLTDSCRIEEPATAGCPISYPIWNETEGRCMSKPLGAPSIPSGPIATSFLPTPVDVQLEQPTNTEPTTQASMFKYIDKQVSNMMADVLENKEAYEVGQKMLFGSVSAQSLNVSSHTPSMKIQSFGAPAAGGTVTGEQNVTCEIFKGDAKECKIAVGGMQDCCESPTTVTLGDYIALTKSIMTMDGIVAETEMIGGYNGAWSYVEAGGDAAWDAVSSLWSSAADTATQEVAGAGMMEAFQQAVMSYTNDFLVEQFGKEVAQMFFQEVGKDAVGNSVLGASPQMAAVGNALMYCYYAYLAYVVFNLLVGMIYECEEEELDLAMKVELLSTHYLGSYCKDKVLGACIEKRKVYCTFDSPLSRIVMEEIYKQPQMGLSWGTTKNPNCQGLALEDIDKVDWDLVNLDEWTAILLETGNMPTQGDINIEALTGLGSPLNTSETSPRQNTLEETKERFENIDVDEAKREAYENAWNSNQ
ncbi:conjugal transfer protein TraN [Vibrio sp. 10N.222.54.A1]|uniref:conjugal transfer protein TraN n=1 Tax=unclassified Vibrio TaxID=2614977 RepID=UPI0035503386